MRVEIRSMAPPNEAQTQARKKLGFLSSVQYAPVKSCIRDATKEQYAAKTPS